MRPRKSEAFFLVAALVVIGATASAQERGREETSRGQRPPPAHAEPHQGPSGYQRVTAPKGWDARPKEFDRGAYQHNFQAARSFHVGAYRRPPGWVARRWAFGEILPRAYWAPQFILTDYWLFALEVPPVGYEWVRDDTDALLVNVTTGEILQVEYGTFA